MKKILAGLAVAGVALAGASRASADQTILTFGFTDLAGEFNLGTGLFRALGVDQVGGPLHSQGDVSRLIGPVGTATYGTGQAANRVVVNLSVSGITPATANGAGSIVITDLDGDTLSANINGQFIANGPAVFFNGTLTGAAFADHGVPDLTFDGPGGGSFLRDMSPALPPFTGAIVQLYIGTAGAFFTQNFSNVSTQVSGALVPGPASLALLGLGFGLAARRRRA